MVRRFCADRGFGFIRPDGRDRRQEAYFLKHDVLGDRDVDPYRRRARFELFVEGAGDNAGRLRARQIELLPE